MTHLNPGNFYHVYNHGNGDDDLFRESENFRFFLQQYAKHISPVAQTYAYCLMPNHFHFLIKIREQETLLEAFPKFQTLEKLIESNHLSKQFSNLFSSYTQSFNKMYQRAGSLFIKNFKRKLITNEAYLDNVIAYIHLNPIHHGFVTSPDEWKWSSYQSLVSTLSTSPERGEVMNIFDGASAFKSYHQNKLNAFGEYLRIELDMLF